MSRKISKEKEVDIGWKHGQAVGGDHRHVKCNYCGKKMHGGVTRLKEHLGGVIGDVQTCKEVPKEVKAEIKAHIFAKRKEKQEMKFEKRRIEEELMSRPRTIDSSEEDENENDEDRDIRRALRASRQELAQEEERMYDRRQGVGSSRPSCFPRSSSLRPEPTHPILPKSSSLRVDPFSLKKQGKSQSSIKAAMRGIKDAKKYVGRAVAKLFYYSHIPYNVANSPYYQPVADAFADVGRGVPPPTAWELANTYLELEVEEIKSYVETFYSHWDEYGCTLMCDGWTTQNRRKIINFLVYSTYGTVFLDSVDATDHFQNAPYIFDLMDKYVNLIGEHRIVQIVTDNAANYKAAGALLMAKRQHLYWSPCAAHCIDLIFSDMAKEEEIKNVIAECQKITGFIYNKGWVLSLMRQETNNKELIRPAITRFATHFIALESVYTHRADLRRVITSRTWSENFPSLKPKERILASTVYELIHGDNFWQEILNLLVVFEPLVKVLRMVDSDDKAEMGYLYEAMDRAKEEIKKNFGRGYKKWWNMIDKRWDRQLHQDIHAAGYFLNPRFQYSSKAVNDNEVLSGFRHVVERLEPDIATQLQIDREAELYRMRVGAFNSQKAQVAIKQLTPAEWWSIIGREQAPTLTRLAIRVLSQTVSSSNCERNWTTFSLIHTKVRNKLTVANLKKLVFVHYNMRLRQRHCQRKDYNDQVIDLDQIFHEDDPLEEWIREVEDRLLDDRDNPWLDEALLEANLTESQMPRPPQNPGERKDKRKKDQDQHSRDDSSSGDQGPTGGGYNAPLYGHATSSQRDYDTSHSHGYREHDRQRGNEERSNEAYGAYGAYGTQHDFTGYQNLDYRQSYDNSAINESYSSGYTGSNYYTPYRHSDVYGDYSTRDMYGTNFGEQSSSQGSQYMPVTEPSRPSAYDNMMISFLGPDQMQYSYPAYYPQSQADYHDTE